MNLSELGINPKTGAHTKEPMTRAENAFLGILWVDHVGQDKKISAEELARRYAFEITGVLTIQRIKAYMRDIRYLHNHLLFDHNIPVLSKAGKDGGYWIAENKEEADAFYATFRKRGLTGLVKASRGKQSAMVDLVTQLSFEFDDLVDKTDRASEIPARRNATPIEVVDAFLKKMTENPEQYADGLRRIGDKYGSVLIPKKRYEDMITGIRTKAAELQAMVASLEG